MTTNDDESGHGAPYDYRETARLEGRAWQDRFTLGSDGQWTPKYEDTGLSLPVRRDGELVEVELLRCPVCACLVEYERRFDSSGELALTRHREWHDRA